MPRAGPSREGQPSSGVPGEPEANLNQLHTFGTTQVQTVIELRINCAPK
jgi:hypothetical protein